MILRASYRERGIAVRPVILLLEPSSALDPISTAKIEEFITELKADYTVVIVTHNMQQAPRDYGYTAYMYLGELVEFGETNQILLKPAKQRKTVDQLRRSNSITASLPGPVKDPTW